MTAAGLDRDIWQFPVVLLADVRSVGVQGDGRTYGHPIVLRPVSSEDAMTADWARLPYDLLERISTRITNEVPRGQPGRRSTDQQAARHHRVGVACASAAGAVVQVHDTAVEAVLRQQLKVRAHAVGEGPGASADEHRRQEQVVLVDESGADRVRGKGSTAHLQVAAGRLLQGQFRIDLEGALDPGPVRGGACRVVE